MDLADPPSLIAVVGQTAAGKSALALSLAEELRGEILSADSRQVYRLMNIGTDKPSPEEQARVPHHMIDVVMPDEPFTLAQYQDGAYHHIGAIASRDAAPLLVGGTPLYTNAVLEGWTIPRVEPDPVFRAALEEEAARTGPEALHVRLAAADPEAARRILPSNTRRIIRALEVIAATGEPMSKQQDRQAPPLRVLMLHVTCDRAELYRRIDARVDRQIERGLVTEVEGLLARGYSRQLPSMSGIGYRQIVEYLEGRASLAEAVQRIKWDTHAFARHQGNWYRRLSSAVVLDTTDESRLPRAREAAQAFLGL